MSLKVVPVPIPMLLWCPACHERHIDVDEFATKAHHTHACQTCGMVWRPALLPTVGVQFLPGFKDKLGTLPEDCWRCRCTPNADFDTSINPPYVSACVKCGAKRPK